MNPRNVVTSMTVSSCFRTPFDSKRVHGSQIPPQTALQHYSPNFPLIHDKLRWKTSLLVRCEILGLFGNTLTADHIYSRHRWKKFPQQVQLYYLKSGDYFLQFLLRFWNARKILPIFKKKSSFIAYIFPKVLTARNVVTLMPLTSCFRIPFESKRVHESQTLVKAALKHFYDNFPLI